MALRERAERLNGAFGQLVIAAGSGRGGPASGRSGGVTVEVDTRGTVTAVVLAPGWQEETPPRLLASGARAALDDAWRRQMVPPAASGPTTGRTVPPDFPAERPSVDDLADLRGRVRQLAADLADQPHEALPAREAATQHVQGRHDGRIELDLDETWAARAHRVDVASELTTVLRSLTRPDTATGERP